MFKRNTKLLRIKKCTINPIISKKNYNQSYSNQLAVKKWEETRPTNQLVSRIRVIMGYQPNAIYSFLASNSVIESFLALSNKIEKCLCIQFVSLSICLSVPVLTLVNIFQISWNWCMLFTSDIAWTILKTNFCWINKNLVGLTKFFV